MISSSSRKSYVQNRVKGFQHCIRAANSLSGKAGYQRRSLESVQRSPRSLVISPLAFSMYVALCAEAERPRASVERLKQDDSKR